MEIKQLNKQIRELKKLKKELRVGSKERNNLNKKLKELQAQCIELKNPTGVKAKLVEELEKEYARLRHPLIVDFRNYSVEQLERRLANVKKGKTLYR